MRLKTLLPGELDGEQLPLYRKIRDSIDKHLQGFVTSRSDGALIGPFNILLHFPGFGRAVWELFDALADHSVLPPRVREIVILLTGARFRALYELYSHESVAERTGMNRHFIAALAVGTLPDHIDPPERVAFDVTTALLNGAQIPNSTFRLAEEYFGAPGLAEIGCTIGCYSAISALLNIFDVDVPGTELI